MSKYERLSCFCSQNPAWCYLTSLKRLQKYVSALKLQVLLLGFLFAFSVQAQAPTITHSDLEPIYIGTLPSNLSWSVDGRHLIFLGAGIEHAVNVSTSDWYQYDTLTNTLAQHNTWPLQPSLSDAEEKVFTPITFGKPSFIFESPNRNFLTYAVEETYELAIANRETLDEVVIPPAVTLIGASSGTDGFNVLWSKDSTAYTVMYGAGYTDEFGTIYVSEYATDISAAVNLYIGESGFNGRYFRYKIIHDISDNGDLVLLTGLEIDPNKNSQYFDSKLILWEPLHPELGQIIDSIPANNIKGATFINDENTLIFVNEHGLTQYDWISGEAILLRSDINSDWVQKALFSPSGDKVALLTEIDGNTKIIVVDLNDKSPV